MADSEVIECEPGIQKNSLEEKRAFSCWRCSDYSSNWRSNLRAHLKRVHKISITMSECCGFNFPDRAALEHHTSACHPRRFKCKSCGRRFSLASNLKRHIGTRSCCDNLRSSLSDHATSCNDNLDQHIELHEDRDDDSSSHSSAQVDLSPASPAPVDSLQQGSSSLDVGSNATFFACTSCPFETKWRHSLKRHRRKVHHLPHRKPVKSSGTYVDAKKGYQKDAVTVHRQRFMCATCDQVFSNSSLLRSHQMERPSHRPFKCNLCDFASLRQWNLNKHKTRMHKNDIVQIMLSEESILPDHLPTKDPHSCEGDAEVPRGPLLRSSRSSFAGRKNRKTEHGDIVEDESMRNDIKHEVIEECSLFQQSSFSEAASDPLVDSVDSGTNELNPQLSLVMTESKSIGIKTNNEKYAIQDSSIFSCPKCSHSTKWRHSLVRHMKVHEREGISSPMSPSLTVQHVSTSSESPHLILSPPGGLRRSGRFSVKPAVSSTSEDSSGKFPPQSLSAINSILEEARGLRSRLSKVETVPSLLSLLLRLLVLSSNTTSQIRAALEVEVRCEAIECFESVWNASKMAIIRWEQLKGERNHDTSLDAVQYVFGTLPVFANWEKNEHLDMLGNVILLSVNTVKNWKQPSADRKTTLSS